MKHSHDLKVLCTSLVALFLIIDLCSVAYATLLEPSKQSTIVGQSHFLYYAVEVSSS